MYKRRESARKQVQQKRKIAMLRDLLYVTNCASTKRKITQSQSHSHDAISQKSKCFFNLKI